LTKANIRPTKSQKTKTG